jgi:hypothetical protein
MPPEIPVPACGAPHQAPRASLLWWPTLIAFHQGIAADRAAFDELMSRAGDCSLPMLVQAERYLR